MYDEICRPSRETNESAAIVGIFTKISNITNKCRLCLKEIFYICYKPETTSLNSKSEINGYSGYKLQWTLKNS